MFRQSVGSILEPRAPVAVALQSTVAEAAVLMKGHRVGAVLVVDEGRLVGIFTERDAVYRVMAAGRDPFATPLGEVMTRYPKTVEPAETFGYALLVMHENGFRHLPVVDQGKPIGVLSARRALDPALEEFTAEAARRKSIRRRATS